MVLSFYLPLYAGSTSDVELIHASGFIESRREKRGINSGSNNMLPFMESQTQLIVEK